MKSFLIRDLLAPLASRMGTAAAGVLIGVTQAEPSLATEIATVITAALLISVDLVSSAWRRRGAQ